MDLIKIASRVMLASQLQPPPVMFRQYVDFIQAAVGEYILDMLEQVYGFRWSEGMDSDALTPGDLAIAEIGLILSPSERNWSQVRIPLDLTGWNQISSMKVPFDARWFTKFVHLGSIGSPGLLKHIQTVYPNVTQDALDFYLTSGYVHGLPFKLDLTASVGSAGRDMGGVFRPKHCEIVVDPEPIWEVMTSKPYDPLVKSAVIETKTLAQIERTAKHEFAHYTQWLMTVILDVHLFFDHHNKNPQERPQSTHTPHAGVVGREYSTESESLRLKNTGDLLEVFDSVNPPFTITYIEHLLSDVEFKTRVNDGVLALSNEWKNRDQFTKNSPLYYLKGDKKAFGLELLKSQPAYMVYDWCIEYAKDESFQRRLQRRRKKYIEEVMEGFLR